ncbi:MAG: hypothetical protein KJ072_00760 [Verrucomicrobia bacterium]|nr:hypothetical protein [Verrucomicrobiota bacterium]
MRLTKPAWSRHPIPLLTAACLLGAFAVGWTALAQSEQWLEYHTGPDTRGYRWLEVTTNPPPNIPLPTLQPGAWYGRWTNGVDATGGRWFCLDRSRRTGPCDRLVFDRNGNDRLDDDAPVSASRREDYMTWFDPIKLVFKGEDGPVSYHIAARFYQFEREPPRLLFGAAGWYEGNVLLAGKKRRVQLIDNTVNGTFNDVGESPRECDRITIETGDEVYSGFLGRHLEIDEQLLQLEIPRDGAFLKAKPAANVAMGTVRVPETITSLEVLGENGHFTRQPEQGASKLPAGSYRVISWESQRKDDKNDTWTLSGNDYDPVSSFRVSADQVATVHLGEPVYAALQLTESRSDLAFSLRLVGALGETVQIMRGNEQPRAPQLQVAGAGFKATRNFEYG